MAEPVTDLTISEEIWRGYMRGGPKHDGPFEFVGTATAPDDPAAAALSLVSRGWAGGTHRILVVNAEEAREFEVYLATKEVKPDA